MRIGENAAFHHLQLDWQGNTLRIGRAGELVCELPDVCHTQEERRHLPGQEVLFLKTATAGGDVSALFIDYDSVQTNVRRVAPHLADLDAVLGWLLPPGFVCRQGDVGFYPRPALPPAARCLGSYPGAGGLAALLNRRHLFEPAASCRFFAGEDGDFHVRVSERTRVVHPEHEAVTLEPGIYRILGARGEPLAGATAPRAVRVELLVL
jgi:hypothetical protein